MVVDSDEPTSLIGAAVSPPWSMVAIQNKNKKTPLIFPPSNHENLHTHIEDPEITSSDSDLGSDSDSNSSSTFSTPWDSPLCSSPKTTPLLSEVPKQQVDSWYVTLCSKLSFVVRLLWSRRGVFLSFRYAVVVVAFLYFRQRRRLRAGEENRARLVGVINERDEKISQLLDQISRMNRVLLDRVPSTT